MDNLNSIYSDNNTIKEESNSMSLSMHKDVSSAGKSQSLSESMERNDAVKDLSAHKKNTDEENDQSLEDLLKDDDDMFAGDLLFYHLYYYFPFLLKLIFKNILYKVKGIYLSKLWDRVHFWI